MVFRRFSNDFAYGGIQVVMKKALVWIMFGIVISTAFLRLETVINNINKEKNRAIYAECIVEKKTLTVITSIVVFATEPTSLQGISPERLPVVRSINQDRLEARQKIIHLIPKLKCIKS